jgi:outer membrane cobalamin receptor
VDIDTTGFEIVAATHHPRWDLVLGYTYLEKNADYGSATVTASFYALNFARHRFTAALVARLGAGFEVRMDNEYRIQEKNALRTIGGNEAVLSGIGLYYLPPRWRGLELSFRVDNLWDSDFQDVPSVPAARRQWIAGATYHW